MILRSSIEKIFWHMPFASSQPNMEEENSNEQRIWELENLVNELSLVISLNLNQPGREILDWARQAQANLP